MNGFTQWVRRHLPAITISSILLLAAFMRLYRLGILPPGLHPDEAANGLDVFRMFDHHDFRFVYDTNGPREALFSYVQALFIGIFGNTALALRLAPAVIGIAGVGATYAWARSWFGSRVGVLAAFMMAVLPWAVTISRDGYQASMLMLMIPLTLWLLTKAIRSGRQIWFVLTGVSLGLGCYTHPAYLALPLALLIIALAALAWRRGLLVRHKTGILYALGTALVLLAPLGIYGIQHASDLISRVNSQSFMNAKLNHGEPLKTLGGNILKTAVMFNVHGDEDYRYNLGGQPELNIFVGAMFVLGLLVALTNIRRLSYLALLAVFVVMLLPAILSVQNTPNALRSVGALAPAVVLAALGITYLLDRWYAVFPINSAARSAGSAALVVLLGLSAIQGYVQYFVAYAGAPETYAAFEEEGSAMANYLNQHHAKTDAYLVSSDYQAKPVEYLTHYHSSYVRISAGYIAGMSVGPGTEIIIPESQKDDAIPALRAKFPKLSVSPHYSRHDPTHELFVVYIVRTSG